MYELKYNGLLDQDVKGILVEGCGCQDPGGRLKVRMREEWVTVMVAPVSDPSSWFPSILALLLIFSIALYVVGC